MRKNSIIVENINMVNLLIVQIAICLSKKAHVMNQQQVSQLIESTTAIFFLIFEATDDSGVFIQSLGLFLKHLHVTMFGILLFQ